jgi:hypothetical protein
METFKCTGCGKIMETIPQCCSQDMVFNEEKNQLECNMGENCGYLSLDELKCDECCKNLNQ